MVMYPPTKSNFIMYHTTLLTLSTLSTSPTSTQPLPKGPTELHNQPLPRERQGAPEPNPALTFGHKPNHDAKLPLVVCMTAFTHTCSFVPRSKVATALHTSYQKKVIEGTLQITGGYGVRFKVINLDNLPQTSESVTSLRD